MLSSKASDGYQRARRSRSDRSLAYAAVPAADAAVRPAVDERAARELIRIHHALLTRACGW